MYSAMILPSKHLSCQSIGKLIINYYEPSIGHLAMQKMDTGTSLSILYATVKPANRFFGKFRERRTMMAYLLDLKLHVQECLAKLL
jgi:hypothetical protein